MCDSIHTYIVVSSIASAARPRQVSVIYAAVPGASEPSGCKLRDLGTVMAAAISFNGCALGRARK
jgi:hypothetical protein